MSAKRPRVAIERMLVEMRFATVCACVAIVGCGFDPSGQAGEGSSGDDSSIGSGDAIFPTDDGSTHPDTRDGASSSDTTPPTDTTPAPDTRPPPDTCIGTGGPCESPGHCAAGVFLCSGACSATDPTGFGLPCTSPKYGCASAVACDGSCPEPATVGDACSKSGCSNGVVQCNLSCALPPTALTSCLSLSCAVPVYADCFGVCPAKSPRSGTTCITCVCTGGGLTTIPYDDCGTCPGCPSGCTEAGDAGTDGGHH